MNLRAQLVYWSVLSPYSESQNIMWGWVEKTHSAIKLDTNPKHVHTCITTHAVWQVSCGSVCETHDIVGGTCHRMSHVAHLVIQVSHGSGTSDILCTHHLTSIARQRKSQRLQSEICNLEIPRFQDCEILRLPNLQSARSGDCDI